MTAAVRSEDTRVPIEELIQFPTRYTFKAVGHHTREFSGAVFAAVRSALGEERKLALRTRLSSKAAYVSVSVVAAVESADELQAVYLALRKVEGVITVL